MTKVKTKSLFLFLLLLVGHLVNAQSFTNGVVTTGYGSSNMFSDSETGPDGKFYALWKYGSAINAANPQTPYFQVKRYDAGTWTTIGGFLATDIPNQISSSSYTMFGDRAALEIDANGTYHVVIQNYISTDGGTTVKHAVTYCKSTNGTSWAFTVLQDNNAVVNLVYSDAHLELDNNDRPHVAFKINDASSATISDRRHYIRHFAYNGTSWTGETALTSYGTTKMNEIVSFAYAIDKNGKSHFAASLESNDSGTDGSLVYFNNVSGSWPAPTFVITGVTANAASVVQAIVVDASAKAHIVSRNLAYGISYSTNKTGAWVVKSLGVSGVLDVNSLAINASGELFNVYNQHTGTNAGIVQYAFMNTSSVWTTGNIMTGNSRTGQYTSVEFSDSHVAMVLFDHFTGTGSPGYGPPNNPRQLQYAISSGFGPAVSAATVTTAAVSTFGQTSATLGGNVTANGGASVTERGVVYATTANPTTANSKVQIGTGDGVFSQSVTTLTAGTKYYVKAYAINSAGTSYGAEVNFTTLNEPALVTSGTLSAFSACSGSASSSQNFTVSGSSLTASLGVTVPLGYEVSLSSATNYSTTVSIVPVNGTVSPTIVYVRLSATASNSPTSNVLVSSSGAVTKTLLISGIVKSKTTGSITQSACGKVVVNGQTYTQTGTYSQTLVNKADCDSVLTVNVTVNPITTLTITNPPAVCYPSAVDITSSFVTAGTINRGALTYWTNAAATTALANPTYITNSGTYYIKSTATGNCTDIKPVMVTLNARPFLMTTNPAPVCQPGTVDITLAIVTAGSTNQGTLSYWTNAAGTIALVNASGVNVSGTYYIKGTTATTPACTDIKPVVVTINDLPTLMVTNPAPVCQSATIDITAPDVTSGSINLGTLSYHTDATVILALANPSSINTAGTYYIKATSATTPACTSVKPVVVTMKAKPDAGTTVTGASITANTGGAAYKWFDCNNTSVVLATSQKFAPTSTGNYGVTVTANTCDNTSACSLVTVTITDVNDDALPSNTISVYPNPASDLIYISLNDDASGLVSITNIKGQLVYENNISGKTFDIATGNLTNGIYILKISSESVNVTQRIVIIK